MKQPRSAVRARTPWAWLLLLALTGCSGDFDATYGKRSGSLGGASVNGTAVLGDMFQQSAHQVSTTSWLYPRLKERADVIVWAPDDFAPPRQEVLNWFDQWWRAAPGRTLVYIGRDFDAAPGYWQAMLAGAPAEQVPEIKRRLGTVRSDYLLGRQAMPDRETGPWFTVRGRRRHRPVRTLAGSWSGGINASKTEIELNGRLVPPTGAQVLLRSGRDVLASRQQRGQGALIVIANGSFLLNLPLVNHEHRKLAGRLLASLGQNRSVVFLESEAGGPPVLDADPMASMRNGLEILGVAPFDRIFLHLAVLGLIFCASRFPIFGPPRPLDPAASSDFGRHVWALGKLLERTRDRSYASGRLEHYQRHVRRESGRYRRTAPAATPGPAPPATDGHDPPQPS